MLKAIIEWSIRHVFLVLLGTTFIVGWGIYSLWRMPVDAIPDLSENQVIVVETLAVKNMMKNHSLAGAIADCSWFEILRQLTYKAAWYGRQIVQVDRFFPSSKTCSGCGYIKQDLKLGDREWTCPACEKHHDRDVNAAKMVLKQGQVQLRVERPKEKPTDSGAIRLNVQSAEVEVGSRYPLG